LRRCTSSRREIGSPNNPITQPYLDRNYYTIRTLRSAPAIGYLVFFWTEQTFSREVPKFQQRAERRHGPKSPQAECGKAEQRQNGMR
jgi:hypothetical protein